MFFIKKILQLNRDLTTTKCKYTSTSTARTSEAIENKVCNSMEEEDIIFLDAMRAVTRPTSNGPSLSAKINKTSLSEKLKNIPITKKATTNKAISSLRSKSIETTTTQEKSITNNVETHDLLAITKNIDNSAVLQSIKNKLTDIRVNARTTPTQTKIHLAAGLSIFVNGSINLASHTKNDAIERLKEFILNGYTLGWHNMHVSIGTSEELGQIVVDLLKSPTGKHITRYAQAPIPMGGQSAWILYF